MNTFKDMLLVIFVFVTLFLSWKVEAINARLVLLEKMPEHEHAGMANWPPAKRTFSDEFESGKPIINPPK